jgi:hypothetical protein
VVTAEACATWVGVVLADERAALCRLLIIRVTPTANTTTAAATATAAHTGCVIFAIQGGGCQPMLADDAVTCARFAEPSGSAE